jgi:hypothetical protein
LAGLKNWEQGMTGEAAGWFTAVAAAKVSADDSWLRIYQSIASDYLADHQTLSSPAFEKLPADIAGCDTAVAALDTALTTLKTRGRARFNVRAWQLDLAKHAKLLAAPKIAPPGSSAWDLVAILAKLDEFAKECRFSEASAYLKALPADPKGATRVSLVSVADGAAVFLTDLEADLAKEPVTGEFLMKAGEVIRKLAIGPQAVITVTDAAGSVRTAKWADFSPDALIALHRLFVKNPKSELERLRRHECAISYDWLAGNRERALAAATMLSQSSPAFKQRWDTIASGLPK